MKILPMLAALLLLVPGLARGASAPTVKQGDWVAKSFKFHTGQVMDLTLHYATLGDPAGAPVLILHGTGGSGGGMLSPAMANELFGPGQPLDAAKHYIILPDSIGAGRSSKPSDGLRAKFPEYNYTDMVSAQHRLVTEHLGVKHLRLVLGYSMGGMHAWLWGTTYPGLMDAIAPLASTPTAMSGRNWMMRRMVIDAVRNDPAWNGGNYTAQPPMLKTASVFFGIAMGGGDFALQAQTPTRAAADDYLNQRLEAPFGGDANDTLYQYQASGDYDPSPDLARITAAVLAVNSADDERNRPDTGVMVEAMKKIKNARLVVVPSSPDTRGHGTLSMAKFYAADLAKLLKDTPVGK